MKQESQEAWIIPKDTEAGAWWIEYENDDVYVCFDIPGRTISINVTEASFGGEIYD